MTKSQSVNASTLGTLRYINSTGPVPKQGNSDVANVLTQGFS